MKPFNTIKITGENITLTNPPCFWNSAERNAELKEAILICKKIKAENLKNKTKKIL